MSEITRYTLVFQNVVNILGSKSDPLVQMDFTSNPPCNKASVLIRLNPGHVEAFFDIVRPTYAAITIYCFYTIDSAAADYLFTPQ